MIFFKAIAACVALGFTQTVLATSFAMTRCYCVSDTEMGWINIYNLTESASHSTVWYRNGTVPRDDFDYPDICGKECTADRSDCWTVPCKSLRFHLRTLRRNLVPVTNQPPSQNTVQELSLIHI